MADSLINDKGNLPKDLQIIQQPQTDKNYYNFKATGLKIDTNYAIKFQWIYEDGTLSPWSSGYFINTSTETVPGAPSATVPSTGSGVIPVTLSSFPTNAKRVDVVVIGGIYGIGKVAYSFFAAGTHNIPVAAGNYDVVLLTVTPSNINGDPTSTFSITVTDPTANLQIDPSVTPSTPTVSSVLGAIQLSWNGKTASGGDQPNGFVAAKVYVGTTSGFTPVDTGNSGANQVDVLNFGNGQNTLNIAVGTIVNGVAMTYNTDYYVKIKTTNGNSAEDSTAVLATGSPARIGKVGSGDIVSITADQITTGTISSQVVTVGSSSGKHVKLSGTGDPITIYGTGGTSDPLLSFSTNGSGQSVLSIKGSGSFSGDISAATGTLTNALNIGTYDLAAWGGRGYPFSVNSSGNIEAGSGKIGGWTINSTQLVSSTANLGQIKLYPNAANGGKIALVYNGAEKITIDPVEGIVGPNMTVAGNTGPAFKITPNGTAEFRGSIYADNGTFKGTVSAATIVGSVITSNSASYIKIDGVNAPGTIQLYANGFETPGFLDVSGSWDSNWDSVGELVISPPIDAGQTGPTIRLYSSSVGGWAGIIASTLIFGDTSNSLSGGRLDGSWEINVVDNTTNGVSGATRRQVRNISAWQGSGPPSGPSFSSSQIGDIVLFYT